MSTIDTQAGHMPADIRRSPHAGETADLRTEVGIFLCRRGKRSAAAASAAAKAGWTGVFNIREGFEGDLDARQQRGSLGGWRYRGHPWVQD